MTENIYLALEWKSSNIKYTNMHIGYAHEKISVNYTCKEKSTTKISRFLDQQKNRYKIN